MGSLGVAWSSDLPCNMCILVLSSGIKPRPLALRAQSLSHWSTREAPAAPSCVSCETARSLNSFHQVHTSLIPLPTKPGHIYAWNAEFVISLNLSGYFLSLQLARIPKNISKWNYPPHTTHSTEPEDGLYRPSSWPPSRHYHSIIFCLKKKNQFCWKSWHTCTSQLQSCFCTMLVTQSLPTLYDPMDCSPPGSSVHGDSPGKNTGTGCHALLQEVFWIQGSNPGLQRCKQIFYCLSYQGSPGILEWVAYPFSRGSSRPRDQTRVSCIAGGFFTSWAT